MGVKEIIQEARALAGFVPPTPKEKSAYSIVAGKVLNLREKCLYYNIHPVVILAGSEALKKMTAAYESATGSRSKVGYIGNTLSGHRLFGAIILEHPACAPDQIFVGDLDSLHKNEKGDIIQGYWGEL